MEERDYWYWLGVTADLGGAAAGRLLALYGDAESVFREKELPIGGGQQAALEESRKKLDELLRERDAYEKAGIHWCHRMDACYPKRMRDIPDPPIILFWRGELPPEEEKTAAVIGARRCSAYGRSMAERFGSALAKEGVAVISGMAMGIDGYAQSAAVNAGGRSFAVLGCGVDQAYPAVNRPLYESLLTAGGGLCDVLLVIEARKVSGTLITVDQALEQGRDVLALPGRLDDPLSEGCNQLIRQGAGILTTPGDALAALGLRDAEGETKEREAGEKARKQAALTAEQRAVFRALSFDPTHLEEIMRKTGFSLGEISLILMVLEEFGLARPVSGGQYVRT